MNSDRSDYDTVSIGIGLGVFCLPLTLLIPDFSVWNAIPKFRVSRFHIIAQYLTPRQLNIALIVVQFVLFLLFLEIRKRKLQEMVNAVMTVTRETDTTMDEERVKQAAAVKACVQLLDVSTDHYENLVLLKDEIRKREKSKQHPPFIEPSTSSV
ncbi:unnamed protein product [Pieris macdunnoughi]|uniref:Endoplasmic reticulum transmembrane protein n=1 Tax=Pieris macdunnoughi TaxID=345717 RepID=A0A821LYA4_9NEOP|nr:unnamed protein product [Pieris macdunnoughi]